MAQARRRGGIFASFGLQVLAGMALGLGLGLLARQLGSEAGQAGHGLSEALRLAGSTFIQLLRVLVPPLVFTAIVASIANLRELQNAAALVWRTLFWFAATALIAVSIGIVLGLVLKPGLNTTVAAAAQRNQNSAAGAICLPTAGFSSAGILGIVGIWTKLK